MICHHLSLLSLFTTIYHYLSLSVTQTEALNFDQDGNFGLLRSRTPSQNSQEWDNYSESPSFKCDQEWARQRLRTSTDNAVLDDSLCATALNISLETSTSESESINMEELNKEIGRLNNLRNNLIRRMKMYTPEDVVEDTLDEVKDELKSIQSLLDEYSNGVETVLEKNRNDIGLSLIHI